MLYFDNLITDHTQLINQLGKIPFISLSFSQFGEDVILKSIIDDYFPDYLYDDTTTGYFVDLGAFHPVTYSNTFSLYILGWRGLNVDASQQSINQFNRHRPGDRNVCVGVSERAETKTFTYFKTMGARNTFESELVEQHVQRGIEVSRTEELKCLHVNELLDKYLKPNVSIQYLSIDLEGFDERVVKALDWQKYKPWIVSVEVHAETLTDALESPIAQHLMASGYKCISKCHLTLFFVADHLKKIKADPEKHKTQDLPLGILVEKVMTRDGWFE